MYFVDCGDFSFYDVFFTALGQSVKQARKTDVDISQEAAQANALYERSNLLAALPFYEDLHAQRPDNNAFREGLAITLSARAEQESEPEKGATMARVKQIALDAKASGDNSGLLQIPLDNLREPPPAARELSAAEELLKQAEKAFSSGNLATAVTLYEKAFVADPTIYAVLCTPEMRSSSKGTLPRRANGTRRQSLSIRIVKRPTGTGATC